MRSFTRSLFVVSVRRTTAVPLKLQQSDSVHGSSLAVQRTVVCSALRKCMRVRLTQRSRRQRQQPLCARDTVIEERTRPKREASSPKELTPLSLAALATQRPRRPVLPQRAPKSARAQRSTTDADKQVPTRLLVHAPCAATFGAPEARRSGARGAPRTSPARAPCCTAALQSGSKMFAGRIRIRQCMSSRAPTRANAIGSLPSETACPVTT